EVLQLPVGADLGLPRRLAVLLEALLVAERGDALAHRAAPALVLARDRLGAALLAREPPAPLDLVGLVLPAQSSVAPWQSVRRARRCMTRPPRLEPSGG